MWEIKQKIVSSSITEILETPSSVEAMTIVDAHLSQMVMDMTAPPRILEA